ncbi:MAG: FixH family protein, partial [Candidatus Thiodiazotropha taylori]|nr:FixH family protein [Candidatus Thiodiazotropha taylori]
MVVVFFTMNMIMIYLATQNNPGLVVDDFYDRGQDYEKNMLKRQARDPKWVMKIKLPSKIEIGQPVVCQYSVKDRE